MWRESKGEREKEKGGRERERERKIKRERKKREKRRGNSKILEELGQGFGSKLHGCT